ncbi:MAG: CoA-binding protein [Planctomycetaceae bacterium]|nr:CoA-binding protein [Planctomycetaceae bacterium]
MPSVAIIGASRNRRKYGNMSVRAHQSQGYDVYPVNPNASEIEGLPCFGSLDEVPEEDLDRISVYLPPEYGLDLLEQINQKGADEVWFNPGSESPEIFERARELGLNLILACSIVDVGVSPMSL